LRSGPAPVDFGTGYSSLSYPKRMAVDKLRIDQTFVRQLADSPEDAAIVRAIDQFGHTLQLQVVAEGVETTAQPEFLGIARFTFVEAELLRQQSRSRNFRCLAVERP
jgi:EAL domain-containing protein (putative c-di-GMP-specific phosphodiesterase class I)